MPQYGLLHSPVCKWPQSLSGQPKTGYETSFTISNLFQNTILCHAIIVRSSAIWLVISNLRSALPHVTRNAVQNTRPSLHVQEGLGTCTRLPT